MEPGIRRLVKGLPELIPQASFYIRQRVKILSVYLSDRLLQNFPRSKTETFFQGVGIQSVHYHPKAPLLLGAFPKKRDVRFLKKVRIIFPLTVLWGGGICISTILFRPFRFFLFTGSLFLQAYFHIFFFSFPFCGDLIVVIRFVQTELVI